jgi:hypothetical protein
VTVVAVCVHKEDASETPFNINIDIFAGKLPVRTIEFPKVEHVWLLPVTDPVCAGSGTGAEIITTGGATGGMTGGTTGGTTGLLITIVVAMDSLLILNARTDQVSPSPNILVDGELAPVWKLPLLGKTNVIAVELSLIKSDLKI